MDYVRVSSAWPTGCGSLEFLDRQSKDGHWPFDEKLTFGGGTWGAQVIPRIGMEVMVAFVDGDPDRPLVTGVVNNPANSVPYDLPANKTRMVLRSNTHKGQGFNEITFEDEAGRENQFFHAQKDQTTRVPNDRTKRIDRHEVASIGGNRAVEVSGNQKHEIGGSVNTVVGGTGPMAMMAMAGVQALSGQNGGVTQSGGADSGWRWARCSGLRHHTCFIGTWLSWRWLPVFARRSRIGS